MYGKVLRGEGNYLWKLQIHGNFVFPNPSECERILVYRTGKN